MKATDVPYVYRHPKSGNYWYMRDIPADVRTTLPLTKKGNPPVRWKESLDTAVMREARIRSSNKANAHNDIIAEARAKRNSVDALASLPSADRQKIELAGGVEGFLKWLDQRAGLSQSLRDEAAGWRDFAAEENVDSDAPDPDWLAGKTAALDAERLQIERQLARDVSVVKALGKSPEALSKAGLPSVAEAVGANRRDPEKITLHSVFEAWEEQVAPVAPEQYEYPVKLFEELHGALPVSEITVAQVRSFRDALAKMPPASGGKFDGMAMPEILRQAEKKGLAPLKASTTAKHFRCLKAIFTFAADESYVNVNVAAGLKLRQPKGSYIEAVRAKRRTFSPAEMTTLFGAAADAGWRDGEENLWFLRLMAYTGARPEELAQLSAQDLVTIGGHLCLSLHDEGDNHIKNPASVRKVPVHPELLRLGFGGFVKGAGSNEYLFSSLESDGRGRRYGRMQRRLTALINGKVSEDPRLVPYSLRHTFRNTMETTTVAPEWVIEGIMGHSDPAHKTGRGYGVPQVAKMAEFLASADPFDTRRTVVEFEEQA